MAVTSFKASGTQADAGAGHGTATWGTPTNAAASDDSHTTASVNAAAVSHYLRLTNFGFTSSDIPAGSTIDGIEVNIEKSRTGIGVFDESILLRKTSGQVGSDKADTGTNWGTTDAIATYGGAADTWSSGLTQADIIDSNFGIDIACKGAASTGVGRIDYVEIRVYYTTPKSPPPFRRRRWSGLGR